MEAFLTVALSFPTVIYTFFLCLCTVLWLLTIMGALSLDTGMDIGGDVGDMGDIGGDIGDAHLASPHIDIDTGAEAAQAVGVLTRLGLNGVPITIVITLLSLFGWIISYQVQVHFLASITVPIIYWSLGLALMVSSLVVAVIITAQFCKPLRKVFKPALGVRKRHLLGQTAIVTSLNVDMHYGEARYESKGADMLLKVRAPEERNFQRGDRVVLLQYNPNQDYYTIISEEEFLTPPNPSSS
ncbi:MAG: hypothetical protein ACRCWR_09330 [Saezia sp.]